jgi:hypothetical protein
MPDDGCKVCRVLRERSRDLPGHERRMVDDWLGVDGDRKGYRTLARELNVRLLASALARAGLPTRGGEAASRYDRLTGDDEATAEALRDVLREAGVPVDAVERDFVSYGVVRTHLRDCLELDRDDRDDRATDDGDDADADPDDGDEGWPERALAYARDHAASTVGDAVRAAVRRGDVGAGGPPDVRVEVWLTCPACGAAKPAADVVADGAVCTCRVPPR